MEQGATLQLVERAMRKDKAAFAELCEAKAREVTYLCIQELGNVEEGRDAAQEVFIHLQKGMPRLRSAHAFNVWLNRIVFTTCNKMRHKQMKTIPELTLDTGGEMADTLSELPGDFVEDEELRRLVVGLIAALPDKYRRCVEMHYYQQLSYAEIGAVLGIDQNAVNNRLRQARGRLKAALDSYLAADSDAPTTWAVASLPLGMALPALYQLDAEATVTPNLMREALSGGRVYSAFSRRPVWTVPAAVVLFATACAATAAALLPTPLHSPASADTGGLPQSRVGSAWAGATEEQTSPAADADGATVFAGRAYLTGSNGEALALPSGAQAVLLDPQRTELARAPLESDGSFRFENLDLPGQAEYIVSIQDASGAPIAGVDDLPVTLWPGYNSDHMSNINLTEENSQ